MEKMMQEDNMLRPLEESVISKPASSHINNSPLSKPKTRVKTRCSRGKRRNNKTHRCNKKCPDGYNRNSKRRCVKK
jgi:hypothetical protein